MSPTSLWICAVDDSGPVRASVLPMRTGGPAWPKVRPAAPARPAATIARRENVGLVMVVSCRCYSKPSVHLRAGALHQLGPLAELHSVEGCHLVALHRPLLDALLAQPRHQLG